jgi:hypothetical protein
MFISVGGFAISARISIALMVLSLASGCAFRAGVEEFRIYVNAFDEVATAADPILTQLKLAERKFFVRRIQQGESVRGRTAMARRNTGVVESFQVEHAVFYSESVDPPYTLAVRHSLNTVQSYNRLLLLYADGQALSSLNSELDRLHREAGLAARAFDNNLVTDIGASISGAVPALAAIRDVAKHLLTFGSRQAFRDELIARHEDVQMVLDALIRSSVPSFHLLSRENIRKLRAANVSAADQSEQRTKIEAKRKMLAEWVVVLQKSKLALARAVQAASTGGDLIAQVAGAAEIAADIRRSAERIRDLSAQSGQ